MKVYHELDPIYDKNSKILILGSIPSVKSREDGFYYAHPQNRFWKILEELFNVKLLKKEDKINFLLKNNIALWDTISTCDIKSSSDSSIKNIEVNDIEGMISKTRIDTIFCTGKKSYEIYQKYIYPKTNINAIYLSSPSPANASKKVDELVEEYKIILKHL